MWGRKENFFIKEIEIAYTSEGKRIAPIIKQWLLMKTEDFNFYNMIKKGIDLSKLPDSPSALEDKIKEVLLRQFFRRVAKRDFYCSITLIKRWIEKCWLQTGQTNQIVNRFSIEMIMRSPIFMCYFSLCQKIQENINSIFDTELEFIITSVEDNLSKKIYEPLSYLTTFLYANDSIEIASYPIESLFKDMVSKNLLNEDAYKVLEESIKFIKENAPNINLNDLFFYTKK